MNNSNLTNANIAEIIVAKEAIKHGLEVLLPFFQGTPYDMVLRNKTGKFIPVQVKKAWYEKRRHGYYFEVTKNAFNRRTRIQRIQYNKNEIHFLIACKIESEDCWILPIKLIKNYKSSLSLLVKKRAIYKNNWSLIINS